MRLSLTMAALAVFVAPGAAQRHLFHLPGGAGERQGWSVAALGDVDGDGRPDFAVGAPHFKRAQGKVTVYSGATGRVLLTLNGTGSFDEFGWSVAGCGDVNGDGTPDLIAGAPFEDANGRNSGSARVHSGKDGSILHVFFGAIANEVFGISVAGAGDVDKDGRPDVIVGAHGGNKNGTLSGAARVFSGRTGNLIHRFDGDSEFDFLGHAVGAAGDVNADGHADVIIGVPDDDDAGSNSGSARVMSGKTGKLLLRFDGAAPQDNFGHSVAAIGDVDKDGVPDLAVAAPQFFASVPGRGYVHAYSGKTGKRIWIAHGAGAGDFFGEPVTGGIDWNGDGVPDLLAGSPRSDEAGADAGAVRVLSGKDGAVLEVLLGSAAGDQFGHSVRVVGDVNDDGIPDLVAGAPFARGAGSARVLSTEPLPLTGDVHEIPLSSGGTQTLSLFAGGNNGSKLYLVLGSMSGTRPGISFGGGVRLPLEFDGYMSFTLTAYNTLIAGSLGTLSANGSATARLTIPQGFSASLAGTQLHHAFLVIDLQQAKIVDASNAVPLRLID